MYLEEGQPLQSFLTGNVQDAFSVNYATSDNGSALAGIDYAPTSGTLYFPANSLNNAVQTFDVLINNDVIVEPTETYTATLSSITGGLVTIGKATATGSILNDDLSEVSIVATTQASEPSSNGLFTLTLTNPVSVPTIVTYSVSGTATSGTDYSPIGTTVEIPANSTSATITVPVLNDNIVETGGETVIVTLLNTTTDVTIGSPSSATVTIADEDVSVLSIAASDGAEPSWDGLFVISMTNPVSVPTVVTYLVGGSSTATAGVDYVALSGTITIPALSTSGMIPVDVINDNIVETGGETVRSDP